MNSSKLLHTAMAVGVQLALGLSVGRWWLGAAVATAFFVGREVSQAEYRWIEHFGGGLRANYRLRNLFTTPGLWSEKSWMWDMALPSLVTIGIAFGIGRLG